MTDRQRRWFYRTRKPEFLWKLGLGIVLAGFVLAWVAEGLAHLTGFRQSAEGVHGAIQAAVSADSLSGSDVDRLWAHLAELAEKDYESFLAQLPFVHGYLPSSVGHNVIAPVPTGDAPGEDFADADEELLKELESQREASRRRLADMKPGPDGGELVLLLWDALDEIPTSGNAADIPYGPRGAELKQRAEAADAPRFTNWALATHAAQKMDLRTRWDALEREGRRFPEAKAAREELVQELSALDTARLAKLVADPAFTKEITPRIRLALAVEQRDWPRVFWLVPLTMSYDAVSVFLALLTASVWFTIVLRAAQTPRVLHPRVGLAVLAVVLGVLSIWPTLFLIYWQEQVWGLAEASGDMFHNFKFFIAGVGLREELSKILLFLPLGIYLSRNGDGPEILALAGCVGLGFALEENVSYFSGQLSAVTIGRFLTANFMHISMTGLIGLSLCRALRNPAAIGDFLGTFTIVVLAHGIYDAVLSPYGGLDFSILAMIILILLAQQYFHQMEELREPQRRLVYSLSFIFIGGLALIFSCTLVTLAFQYGAYPASILMYFGALASAILIIVFLRQFKEVGRGA